MLIWWHASSVLLPSRCSHAWQLSGAWGRVCYNTITSLSQHVHARLGNTNKATKAKANRTRAFVHINLKPCPAAIQSHCYKTLARPVLERASAVCDTLQMNLKSDIEMVQRRAARRNFHDLRTKTSATDFVARLEPPKLEIPRKVIKLYMTYNVINAVVDKVCMTYDVINAVVDKVCKTYDVINAVVDKVCMAYNVINAVVDKTLPTRFISHTSTQPEDTSHTLTIPHSKPNLTHISNQLSLRCTSLDYWPPAAPATPSLEASQQQLRGWVVN